MRSLSAGVEEAAGSKGFLLSGFGSMGAFQSTSAQASSPSSLLSAPRCLFRACYHQLVSVHTLQMPLYTSVYICV